MRHTLPPLLFALTVGLVAPWHQSPSAAGMPGLKEKPAYRSHPPMRALPTPSSKPMGKGPAFFVDAGKGNDAGDGSQAKPWKTVGHAVKRLRPGDTLYLRGGTYYEHVSVTVSGTDKQPITIRSYPGELAILDGGLREFHDDPANAWEPVPGGAEGEFRSRKAYPGLGPVVMGHFADSMIPLHGYRHLVDLRTANEYWNLRNNQDTDNGIYCGPGLWYDSKTQRIHVRLAHTKLPALGADNYRGETDPRKLPLIVAGSGVPLKIENCKHLRIHGLVVRGGSRATISLTSSEDIELDHVTVYGGSPALMVQSVRGLRITDCAFRGISAPWSFRTSHKYRGVAAYLLTVRQTMPPTRNVEIAYSELTDSHDGPFLGTVKGLKLHHNLVDNFNDDGIYLTAMGVGGDLHIYQNRLSRCLHVFAFFGKYETGSGVYVYRNVIDLRPPVHYFPPSKADDPRFGPKQPGGKPGVPSRGRLCGDHGSPTWEPIYFYHNTVLADEPAFRNFYGAGWGGHTRGTKRRVFNNVFVQTEGNPGLNFSSADDDLHADGNLHWGLRDGPTFKGDFFAPFRKSPRFAASKKHYAPGWGARDLFADPRFNHLSARWDAPLDLRLREGSPAVDAGLELPADWPDPLRKLDRGRPDIGALAVGTAMPPVGPRRAPP
ncbi:MAG: DUF1565 domain-containing protein [Gemmataceae bacterium]|nr:DUF1565 domain-containing protein [Gemmataceae bacterium]